MSDLVKELREQFDQYGIVDFEANDIFYLFQRIAELEETNRAYKEAWSVNILTERIDQLEPFCERFVNAYPDWRDEYEALGEAK